LNTLIAPPFLELIKFYPVTVFLETHLGIFLHFSSIFSIHIISPVSFLKLCIIILIITFISKKIFLIRSFKSIEKVHWNYITGFRAFDFPNFKLPMILSIVDRNNQTR